MKATTEMDQNSLYLNFHYELRYDQDNSETVEMSTETTTEWTTQTVRYP